MSGIHTDAFLGLRNVVVEPSVDDLDHAEVNEDLEDERVSILPVHDEDMIPIPEDEEEAVQFPGDLDQLRAALLNASKGVTEGTDKQYKG